MASWTVQRKTHFLARLISILLVGSLALLAGPLTAKASIWTLEVVSPDVEEMLASAEAASTSAATSSSGSNPTPSAPHDERDDSEDELLMWLLTANSSTGGSSSGTSSSSSGANGSALACDVSPTFDADVVASVCGERHLTLPMPPGNDLLRPPQS